MTRTALLLRKDMLVLRRSPVLLAALVAYPLVIALLVGLVAGYANAKPRVALVDEDGLPRVLALAGERYRVDRTIDRVSKDVKVVRLSADEAARQLANGKIVATITVPPGFIATLKGMVRSPELRVQISRGPVELRVREQVQALVYSLNRLLQKAYIATNLGYVQLILHGGKGQFLGNEFDVLGLDRAQRMLDALPSGQQIRELRAFVHDARLALDQTGNALRATANPIVPREVGNQGRSWALSAEVQAYALALTISFLALMLSAAALAAERDENVIGRLSRGLVTRTELVASKIALAAAVALAVGIAIALVFGVIIEVGGVEGGEPWLRLPLLAVGLALAGGALGALGALLGTLAREARTASLVALLVVLPIVFLGIVPREVVPAAGWVSDALPFAHAVRFFSAALYDLRPASAVAREGAWLLGLGLLFAAFARAGMRRLSA